jgi:hypothetical protein
MAIDSIVAEVRQARETLAKRFDYDLRAMLEDAKKRQAAGGRKTVSFQAKPVRRAPPLDMHDQDMHPTGVAGE